jgi:hypothetical protein
MGCQRRRHNGIDDAMTDVEELGLLVCYLLKQPHQTHPLRQ